jgi:hypothetical protein
MWHAVYNPDGSSQGSDVELLVSSQRPEKQRKRAVFREVLRRRCVYISRQILDT